MSAIFFDLDNTIYDYQQYVLGAFKEISWWLGKKYNLSQKKIYLKLVKLWRRKSSAYPHLFNDLLKESNLEDGKAVKSIVRIFNRHQGRLKPYPGVIKTLRELKKQGCSLGIITDGHIERQRRKINALSIKNFFKVIIYTKKIAAKPSAKPFSVAAKKIKTFNCIYVGDNPEIDFEGAKACGMTTVRLLKGEFKSRPKNKYVDYEIKEFNEIINYI